jgi:L-aminopeptidase/D-esterase-like protein
VATIGKHNGLTDVEGILVGHFTDTEALSGVTVAICPEGAVAGVDVRGSAPGTRETDLLNPINLVNKVQAVVLSGGSVYGLSASHGVVAWLAERGCGFSLDAHHVAPIVPAVVLYDLGRGADFIPPINDEWGRKACEASTDGPVSMGCVGAGTGALSGSIKGGLGTASLVLDSGVTVAAVVAVNSLGMVINPENGRIWEACLEREHEFGEQAQRRVKVPPLPETAAAQNTTIGIVATDAILTKVQAQKVAQMAHDGMGRAIRPAHTMFDGDTIFCLATGKKELVEQKGFFLVPQAQALTEIGHAAADCMSRAIIHGILSAKSMAGIAAFCDLEDVEF